MHSIFGSMKFHKIAVFCAVILLSCFCLIGSASSLTYQSSVGVNFTFNPTISLSVGGNLLINNLTPGNSSDSNIIDVAVSTNASYGYVLSATVGQKNGTDSLVNTSNSTYTFTNLSTTAGSAATLSNFADNKWGYSYSVDNGTNWISGSSGSTASGYAGLPLDNNDNAEDRGLGGVTLIDTDNPADNQTIKFKIGAKAANDQAAGTYSNTINFYAVANAGPMSISDAFSAASKTRLNGLYKMQDMTSSICDNTELEGEDSQTQLIDTRDNKVYWVAKMPDGRCWMTQNLDHDIKTDADFYTYYNTDIGHGTTSNTNAKWTADKATYAPGTRNWTSTNRYIIQQSYDPGNLCWDGVVNINGNEGSIVPCGNQHYHLGNYYSWSAAVAMNDTSSYTNDNVDVNQSICPAGWMLPKAGSYEGSGSFTYLASKMNNEGPEQAPTYFSFGSGVEGNNDYLTTIGHSIQYWSSVVRSSTHAYRMIVTTDDGFSFSDPRYRDRGFPLRCLAR